MKRYSVPESLPWDTNYFKLLAFGCSVEVGKGVGSLYVCRKSMWYNEQ